MIDRDTKIVVYTSIFRSEDLLDRLHAPEFDDPNFDYVCFTPHKDIKAKGWLIVPAHKSQTTSSRMQAKKFKIFPHRYFYDYEYSIWLDGSFAIKSDLRGLLIKTMNEKGDKPFIFFENYQGNCAYDSAEFCIKNGIGDTNKIHEQMEKYYREGFPEHYGLPMCGMLFRKHNDISVQAIMNYWWEEIVKHSDRDQLSLPYVMWKYRLFSNYATIENKKKRLWNAYFRAHSRKRRYNEPQGTP